MFVSRPCFPHSFLLPSFVFSSPTLSGFLTLFLFFLSLLFLGLFVSSSLFFYMCICPSLLLSSYPSSLSLSHPPLSPRRPLQSMLYQNSNVRSSSFEYPVRSNKQSTQRKAKASSETVRESLPNVYCPPPGAPGAPNFDAISLRLGSFIISLIEGGPPPDCIRSALFRIEERMEGQRETRRTKDEDEEEKNVHVSNSRVVHESVESSRGHHLRRKGEEREGGRKKSARDARRLSSVLRSRKCERTCCAIAIS